MEFLSNIDPNLIVYVIGVALAYLKLRKDQTQNLSITSALAGALREQTAKLLAERPGRERAREVLEAAAYKLLEQLKIKRSAAVEIIVKGAIDTALAELELHLEIEATVKRHLADALAQLDKGAQGVLEATKPKPPGERTVPPLELDITFVEPRGDE